MAHPEDPLRIGVTSKIRQPDGSKRPAGKGGKLSRLPNDRITPFDGNVFFNATCLQLAQEYGVEFVAIDPKHQKLEDLNQGFIRGVFLSPTGAADGTHVWREDLMPPPNVLFDPHTSPATPGVVRRVFDMVPHHVIPRELRAITGDKLKLAQFIDACGLGKYQPKTQSFSVQTLVNMLNKYKDNGVVLRPRGEGNQSSGIVFILPGEQRYRIYQPGTDDEGENGIVGTTYSADLWARKQRGLLDWYVIQEYKPMDTYIQRDEKGEPHIGTTEVRIIFQRESPGSQPKFAGSFVKLLDPTFTGKPAWTTTEKVLTAICGIRAASVFEEIQDVTRYLYNKAEGKIGKPIGEWAVDFGLSRGRPFIMSTTSLPGETRKVFDRINRPGTSVALNETMMGYARTLVNGK